MKFGYIRVSTRDQNTARQEQMMKDEGCDRVFIDKCTGRHAKRPKLLEMMSQLREGDELLVTRLSRFGRSMKDLINLVGQLRDKKVSFRSLKEGLTFDSTAFGQFTFHIFAAMAQFESDLTSERTKEGLKVAFAAGRVGGRPKGLSAENEKRADIVAKLYESGCTIGEIKSNVKISVSTIYKYLKLRGVKVASSAKYKKRSAVGG